jgi:hypothetical protein
MGRRKNSDLPKAVMKKPKWKPGDIVEVEFIGVLRTCEIISLKKNKHDTTKWVYDVIDKKTHTIIPAVGVGNTERWANIKILEEIY